jgi:hypothetical protein
MAAAQGPSAVDKEPFMQRLTRLACSFATASLIHLVACGGTDAPASSDASFASASQVQKERMIIAASGVEGTLAYFAATAAMSTGPDTTCPRVERTGSDVTVTGGCTDDSGTRLTGSFTGKNVPSLFGGGNDPTRPVELAFDGWSTRLTDDSSAANDDWAFDGTLTMHPDRRMVADLAVTLGGMQTRTRATWRPSGELTTADAGSTVELTGFGSAELAGSWRVSNDAPAGAIELHAADVLRVDLAATVDGCAPMTVDGAPAGQLCDADDAE